MAHHKPHTPGPWLVNQSDTCLVGIVHPLDKLGGCIVHVADVMYLGEKREGEKQANARLIARAPEMEKEIDDLRKGHLLISSIARDYKERNRTLREYVKQLRLTLECIREDFEDDPECVNVIENIDTALKATRNPK